MALPKARQSSPTYKINSFTEQPLNEDVKENDIVKIKNYSRYSIQNGYGDKIDCIKVEGTNNEEYLISFSFINTIAACDAIMYKRTPYPSLFFGEMLVDPAQGPLDDGYAWVPVKSEYVND